MTDDRHPLDDYLPGPPERGMVIDPTEPPIVPTDTPPTDIAQPPAADWLAGWEAAPAATPFDLTAALGSPPFPAEPRTVYGPCPACNNWQIDVAPDSTATLIDIDAALDDHDTEDHPGALARIAAHADCIPGGQCAVGPGRICDRTMAVAGTATADAVAAGLRYAVNRYADPAPDTPPRAPVHETAGHVPGGPLLTVHPGTYIEQRIPAGDMTLGHLADFVDTARAAGLGRDTPGGVLAYSTADRGTAYLVLRANINTPTADNDPDRPEQQR